MSGSASIVTAEKLALAGNNESQDSQRVLDEYQRLYGIGLLSSSPPQDETPFYKVPHPARKHIEGTEAIKKALQGRITQSARSLPLPLDQANFTGTRNATINDRAFARSLPSDISTSARQLHGKRAVKAPGPRGRQEKVSSDISVAGEAKPCAVEDQKLPVPDATNLTVLGAASGKMDSSQSPTQSNDGRSYDRYVHASPRSDKAADHHVEPVPAVETLTQSSIYEQKSLSDDDTGAVVFDIENPVANHTGSSLPSDHSPVLVHASVRARTFALQHHTSQSQERPPETPAVRNNPFAGNNHFQLVPTSQLFKATQFSSALRRGASPTSSRPSPNDFPHNTISPNPISSPLKARGLRSSPTIGDVSSPQVIRTTDSPRPGDAQTTRSITGPTEAPVVPESPRYRPLKARAAPAPMDVYVPMRESQERRSSSVVPPATASPELSDDGEDPIDRRRRARSKKDASLKQLTSIQFTRTPKSEAVEVPSTNTKRKRSRTAAQEYIDQCHDPGGSHDDPQLQDRVENSQDLPARTERSSIYQTEDLTQSSQDHESVPVEGAIARSSAGGGPPSPKRRRRTGLPRLDSTETNILNGETIPETSPVNKPAKHPLDSSGAVPIAGPKPSSNTVIIGSSREPKDAADIPKSSVTEYVPPPATASGNSIGTGSGPDSPIVRTPSREQVVSREEQVSSPTLPNLDPEKLVALPSSPPAPAFSTRSRTRQQPDLRGGGETPAVPSSKELPNPSTSMSTLSVLSATPSLTMSTSASGSQNSAASRKLRAGHDEATNSSPAVAKNNRRRAGDLPRLKTGSTTENLRASTRLSRQYRPDSTDELAKSPSMTPTFEQSVRGPPRKSTSRPVRTSTAEVHGFQDQSHRRAGRLFDGMAFAISFQAKKPNESADAYGARMDEAKSLETRIMQAGGRVLENGFDELFESGPVRSVTASPVAATSSSPPQAAEGDVTLVPGARYLGFTALVADGHSRKEKYVQALALGLPCIAARWITTCLDRGEIVDWAPYLLCAGQSAFLGGAYKSRILVPYDAAQAQLAQTIDARPRLLDGNRILLVMKKSEKKSEQGKKMMKYVFLARVLGATLCRAQSVNEAKEKLKASQDLGRPFDWVYAGSKVDKTELFADAVTGATDAGANSKKRKRGSGNTTATAANPTTKIRTLTDELVIQSLILGRIIQEDEMGE